MRHLGIDYGTRKVGLALSDEAGAMGFPHSVATNTPRLVDEVAELVRAQGVGRIVIGESRDFKGAENPVAQEAQAFAAALAERTGVPIEWVPETLTTSAARRAPEKPGARRATRAPARHPHVDASAAALILTDYLSRNHD